MEIRVFLFVEEDGGTISSSIGRFREGDEEEEEEGLVVIKLSLYSRVLVGEDVLINYINSLVFLSVMTNFTYNELRTVYSLSFERDFARTV